MKNFVLPLLLLLAACNSNNKPTKDDEKYDKAVIIKDTMVSDPVRQNATPLSLIRQRVTAINISTLQSKHVEFICDEKTSVNYYYKNTVPVKIAIDYGWVGDAHAKEDYYFDGGKLIFIYEFVEGGPACEGCIKSNEYRSYINDDKVFKYLKNKDEAKCKRCEFGTLSKPYKLLTTSTAQEARKVLCN